ncbi:MAG: pyrroline-5-carboxylate reductase [Proteobacteria bacterium]|jgi:pyrroline-5-carboxylate reductase|nr:pyrroline-5-carboxylate reductase [Pseudomonadota bacterium]MDA1300741.1 pyrroline-5-carboxylate reductase [Pseudomonadota bacterium]
MKLTFLGAGNIARAIFGGLIDGGMDAGGMTAADPWAEAREAAARMGLKVTSDNRDAAGNADVVVVAVKPNVVADLCQQIAPVVDGKLIISVAAGITTGSLRRWLGENTPIIRCMPNTPALVRRGITGLYGTPTVEDSQRRQAEEILSAVGKYIWVNEESELDAVTAVSGSGPAYFFAVMEAIEAAGHHLGLSPEVAHKLVVETALGAAMMAEQADVPAGTLRERVTSPGGTTSAALDVFNTRDLSGTFDEAIAAAHRRSIELGAED